MYYWLKCAIEGDLQNVYLPRKKESGDRCAECDSDSLGRVQGKNNEDVKGYKMMVLFI